MRILHVAHGFVPEAVGGVELQTYYLASALAAEHAVGVLVWTSNPERPDYTLEARRQGPLEVWRLNHRFVDIASFAGVYRNARVDALFEEVVGAFRPDVVHVQHLIGLSTGILERTKRRGLPLVLTLWDLWFGCPRGQRIRDGLVVCHEIDRRLCVPCLRPQHYELRAPRRPRRHFLRGLRLPTRRRGLRLLAEYDRHMHEVLSLPDALVSPSSFHRDVYVRYGLDAARMHIIPGGLPALPARPVARDGGLRIGFLGTLIPSKGVHVLLEAYRLLARPETSLDVFGHWVPFHGDTGYRERLEAAAASMPGTVRFHGRYAQEDVGRILGDLDVLVVPSLWWESYCLVIREGFLAGVPVVASGHGAMAEAIEHDVSGLLFRPGDAADLAVQLRRLLDEPGLRERLAAHPKRVASVADVATAHEALYAALLTRDARRA